MLIYAPHVYDGCEGIRRELCYLSASTNTNLRADPKGTLAMSARLLALLDDKWAAESRRVLIVTLKTLATSHEAELKALFPHAEQVHVRWFGNIAGTNAFQEGGPQECDAFVTLGDYYANRTWQFEYFGRNKWGITEPDKLREFVIKCGHKQVQNELGQAHGRARDPRRTTPCRHVHLGRVVPMWWQGRGVVIHDILEERAVTQERLMALVVRALECVNQTALAALLGVSRQQVSHWVKGVRPIPEKHEGRLVEICAYFTPQSEDAVEIPPVDYNV